MIGGSWKHWIPRKIGLPFHLLFLPWHGWHKHVPSQLQKRLLFRVRVWACSLPPPDPQEGPTESEHTKGFSMFVSSNQQNNERMSAPASPWACQAGTWQRVTVLACNLMSRPAATTAKLVHKCSVTEEKFRKTTVLSTHWSKLIHYLHRQGAWYSTNRF